MNEVFSPSDAASPQADPVAQAKAIRAARPPTTAGNPLRVLIAEDSPVVLQRLVAMIHRLGRSIQVTTAANGYDAGRLFDEVPPDVVVLDIAMPGPNGFDLLATFKIKRRECVVIMLTTYAYPEFREHAARIGADFFFNKVQEFEHVAEVLTTLSS